ncbi:MAG: hypothetical protein ACOC1U_06150, partial [Spirochaetota bacterium]
LATGLWARPLAALYTRLLAPANAAVPFPYGVFTPAKLLTTLPVVIAGIVLYFGVTAPVGMRIAHRIEAVAPELRTVLLFFVFGLGLFAIAAYV